MLTDTNPQFSAKKGFLEKFYPIEYSNGASEMVATGQSN